MAGEAEEGLNESAWSISALELKASMLSREGGGRVKSPNHDGRLAPTASDGCVCLARVEQKACIAGKVKMLIWLRYDLVLADAAANTLYNATCK